MYVRLDLESDVPIYTQLVQQIIEGIATRQLAPGEALPSVRSLAGDLGINLHTVNKAYHLLRQEGFIQIHRQKGVIVQTEEQMPTVTAAYVDQLALGLRPIAAEAVARGMKQEELVEHLRAVLHALQTVPQQEEETT